MRLVNKKLKFGTKVNKNVLPNLEKGFNFFSNFSIFQMNLFPMFYNVREIQIQILEFT